MSEKTNIAALDYLNSYDTAVGEAMTGNLKDREEILSLLQAKISFLLL